MGEAHLVECLQEEVIVNCLGRLTIGDLLAHGIRRVRNREITERNIGCSDIEISVEVALYLLEAHYAGQD